MGSFCEGVLSFSFRKETPDHVMAAFAALADPAQVESNPYGVLPTDYALDADELGWTEADPYPDEPWRHNWADPLSWSMGVSFVGHTRLFWSEMKRWTLSARFSLKDVPERILRALTWLGPYIEPTNGDQPLLLGYLRHEYETRPVLVWHQGNRIYGEDLRQPHDAAPGLLIVVCGLPGSGREEHMADHQRRGERAFDRFHEASINHDPHPLNSRYAGAVLRAVEHGDVARVSDVAFCSTETRSAVIEQFQQRVPDLLVQVISYDSAPEQCRRNVVLRAKHEPGHDLDFELKQIDRFSPAYAPVGEIRPVLPWAPAAGPGRG
jgi:hypothetical protein